METSSTYHPEQTIDVECFIQNRYDFIIIGGGTAGLTIAARLTEDPCVTVGVLEAGKNRLGDPLIDVPGAFMGMLHNQEYDWIFKTTPQANNKNRRHHIPRGKALGGSSAINYMMYVRGSLQDYDDWAILADDPEWGSERMLHYMRKHQTLDRVDGDTACDASISYVEKNHGVTGPVHTSFNDNFLSIESDYRKAFGEVTGILKNPIDASVSHVQHQCVPTNTVVAGPVIISVASIHSALSYGPVLTRASGATLRKDILLLTLPGLTFTFSAKLLSHLSSWMDKRRSA